MTENQAKKLELKKEYSRPSFKKKLIESVGTVCVNCGSDLSVEYHHIVPLAIGGTNRITNIVPLCHVCHEKAHGGRNIRQIMKPIKTGRKRKPLPPDYEEILELYFTGKIGRKECEKRLGLKEHDKLTEKAFFKEYLKEKKIVSFKNRVDMLNTEKCKKVDHSGEFIAKVIYEDGTERISY